MPLHGKIVVINRSGSDGSELPLKAPCLFGRKPDSDIRIRLPQVSKEHCRIDLNENKEVILTNLSSVNPTLVNGEPLQQAERLKHGDVITIIDRCFRFEYPPPRTPSKRSSLGRKSDSLKVHQLGDSVNVGPERKSSDDDRPKDGHDHNISHCLDETVAESNQDKNSPFSDLYQMIKKSLDIKTPLKASDSCFQTPSSKFCTPKPVGDVKSAAETTPKKDGGEEGVAGGATQSTKKQRMSSQNVTPNKAHPEGTSQQQKRSSTPLKFTVSEVIEQVVETPKSPKVRSREATPAKATTKDVEKQTLPTPQSDKVRRSPRDPETGKVMSQKRKSGELVNGLPTSQMKRKRVSFGGHLSPELFDKKMPPDSPLRKGATPRRSLCISKPKHSLLRRASVIGLLKETDQEHSDAKSPAQVKTLKSPAKKPKTPSPQKLPKSRSTSPKAPASEKKSPKPKAPSPSSRPSSPAAPVQKAPKPRTPSPQAETPGKMTPEAGGSSSVKSKKAGTPLKESVGSSPACETSHLGKSEKNEEAKKSRRFSLPGQLSQTASTADNRRASLAVSSLVSQAKTSSVAAPAVPPSIKVQTPSVQGRFSVSRISTPSPVTESTTTDAVSSAEATPKIPIKRKSMKKTPKSVAKIRRSGVSRASMKAFSFADIVKFGKAKMQVAALAQRSLNKKTVKTVKKTAAKPQTPAKKLLGYASTGHAASPATIVVGRALKQKVVPPTGAPPTVVFNTAILKKDVKVDEDLSGVSEMFKTPMNNKSRPSVVEQHSASQTPVVEQSVLNTPEETGEMVVSPLTVASVVRGRAYNSEAVKRLLNGQQDDSTSEDIPPLQIDAEESGEQTEKSLVTTPKQKPAVRECLTGVKRIMKTPKQKPEPVEDLRGKILKTPKQKPEQPECLTAVKRIMKTPKQKSEPIEDLRGKILKTPKQRPPQQESLTGVKRLMKTPKQKAEPVEDLRGKLLITPKQKPEQRECLTGVKRIMSTPKQRSEPVEEHFGIKRLVTSPRLPGNPPVEDFEGLQELMEEPVTHPAVPAEPAEVQDEMQLESEPQASVEEPADAAPPGIESNVQAEALPSEICPNVPDPDPGNDADQVGTVGKLDADVTIEEPKTYVAKPRRGRKAEASQVEAPVEEMVDPAVKSQPPVRARRGRPAKNTEENPGNEAVEPQEPVQKVRKGRKQAPAETLALPEEAEEPVSVIAEDDLVTAKSKGASKKKEMATAPAENPDDLTQAPKISEKPKRGRGAKPMTNVSEEVQEGSGEPEEKKPRGRRVKSALKDEAPDMGPAKRARRGAAKATEETSSAEPPAEEMVVPAEMTEKSQPPVRARRGGTAKNTEENPENEAAEPQEPVQKVRKGRKQAPVETLALPEEAEEPVTVIAEDDLVTAKSKRGSKTKELAATVPESAANPDDLTEAPTVSEKPKRGRGAKPMTDVSEEVQEGSGEPEEKKPRGRRVKSALKDEAPDMGPAKRARRGAAKATEETSSAEPPAEEMVVPAGMTEKSQPPVRARRGRLAKNTEENPENEAAEPQEPVQKVRKGRKQAPVETLTLPEEAEEPIAEDDLVTAKSKRASKTKDIATVPADNSGVLTEVPTVSEKPKRGRGAKPMTDVSEEVQEGSGEPEEKKPRGRRVKSALKDEAPEMGPAKRARRGAAKATEETSSAELSQEPDPVVKGRRGLKKPDDSNVQDSCAIKEEPKVSKRAVKWKEELEVHEIPKATPKKAVRGRKPKLDEQNDTEDVKMAEEEKLSEELVEPQPAKRSRRGAKAVDEATSKILEAAQDDLQPKTRRGRSAKK